MLRNHLLVAWRNLVKRASFSAINILGLAIGIAVCLLIYLYVHYELTYDRYNEKADRIARLTVVLHTPESDMKIAACPMIVGDVLKRDFPEVEDVARFGFEGGIVKRGTTVFNEPHWYTADQSAINVFTFKFLAGNAVTALTQPNSLVLTHSMAIKYFGRDNVIGQVLTVNKSQRAITGVVEDRPANSDLPIDALMSADLSKGSTWVDLDESMSYSFVLFRHTPDLVAFTRKLRQMSKRLAQPEFDKQGATAYHLWFTPELLKDVHYSEDKMGDTPKGNRSFNTIFSLLAIFVLLIALLNYINLSTAKATERAKEVGIRKVNGAGRGQLVRQFLFESLLLVSFAWSIALGLAALGLPLMNKLLDIRLPLHWAGNPWLAASVFLATVFLAGTYPALVLSSFKPALVLKGSITTGRNKLLLRKIITVAQFTITAVLITGALAIFCQVRYLAHKDLGFDKTRLINIVLPDSAPSEPIPGFLQALRVQSNIAGVSAGATFRSEDVQPMATTFAEKNGGGREEFVSDYFFIDTTFISLVHIPLIQGRNFSAGMHTDSAQSFIVNQAFVRKMGWRNPIGKTLEGFNHKGPVVGVVGDFYYRSLHNALQPLAIVLNTTPPSNILVKATAASLPAIKSIWKTYFPDIPINYGFLDEQYDAQYKKDKQTMALFNVFTLLAIGISCLGLYGLVSLVLAQRTREIGIRKVLGAPLPDLVVLLTKGFLSLVALSSLIAIPIAVYALHRWLETYPYHIPLAWWMFVAPLLSTALIAVLTTGYRVLRAATANPVISLRTD
ncbi:MAG TPA: FtsX-like permease family protein [Dinghuibacter sp.]|uniref:ABC transporter permease n=1 Tax=Dinghuibacter sp. TaxID=2024697 RepID=UPI002B85F227|nr:FtsX-like permease family protein [Dinghuibacter sp.]HTJ13009.1 FtsX-like permease family protein [Dinghuibacter sp.]